MAQPARSIDPQESSAAPLKKRDTWGWLTALLTVINLATLGGVAYFNRAIWDRIEKLNERVEEIGHPALAEAESPVGRELQPKNFGVQFPLESFLVNLASSEGPKFLQLQMQLELSSPSVEEELIRKKAVIRDSIISLLTSRSYNDLRQTEGMEKLRTDIKGRVNNLLSTGKIQQVFFTQFHFN